MQENARIPRSQRNILPASYGIVYYLQFHWNFWKVLNNYCWLQVNYSYSLTKLFLKRKHSLKLFLRNWKHGRSFCTCVPDRIFGTLVSLGGPSPVWECVCCLRPIAAPGAIGRKSQWCDRPLGQIVITRSQLNRSHHVMTFSHVNGNGRGAA